MKDQKVQKDAIDFRELFAMEWVAKISTVCIKTMDENKFNKITLLPITEDLLKLRQFLKQQIPILTSGLNEKRDLETWRELAEVVSTRLTVFNRRRGNEVNQLLVEKFNEREKWKKAEMEEIKNSLSPLEKRLVKR